MRKNRRNKNGLTKTQTIALSFLLIILVGAGLLMLPIASRTGTPTDFLTALFTATSASCVTGLVVVDTYTHWSTFGQMVIITLIQIGGLGVITMAVLFAILFKKNITLKSRNLLQESINSLQLGGIVRLIRKVIKGTLLIEGLGAVCLMFHFIPKLGVPKGIYYSVFHAISAFCNAGFDLMGYREQYSSFVYEVDSIMLNVPIMLLIIIGGIGFVVWDDISANKHHFRKYQFSTKLVISTTAILIFGGAVLFYVLEADNVLADLSVKGKILASFFGSVTARTAGFNTVDTAAMKDSSILLTEILMFIGGSPGSTAGGIKTTTIAVIVIYVLSNLKQTKGANVFGRCLSDETIKKSITVFMLNLSLAIIAAIAICALQKLPMRDVLFEVFSANGTVGMTTGITRDLSDISRIIIILLMYAGRIGSMTFALVFAEGKMTPKVQLPKVDVSVG
ncbi:MAG: Trk family potassium uptake protein [Lachnospiraceae bacterium]|nr:Trk family potassium uptake protein [Lachnospiraceae bacterium]